MSAHSQPGLEVSASDGIQTYERQVNQSTPWEPDIHKEDVGRPASTRKRNVLCGLGPLAFAMLLASVTFISGGALGGGLGAGLSRSSTHGTRTCSTNASTTSTIPTPPSTSSAPTATAAPLSNYSVLPYTNVTSFAAECPPLGSSTYVDAYNQLYTFSCGVVYPPGATADPEYGYVIGDLASALAYSMADCTLMCTLWNTDAAIPHATTCRGVSWVPEVNTAFKDFGANCVLKNATGPGTPFTTPYIMSAKLICNGC